MKNGYSFSPKHEFIIEDFDKTKTFASFLPGIAGVDGIPMWSFYVNRGQAMASFGVNNKDNCIMEFFPANTMYKNVELQGFRTFLKYENKVHEVFSSYPDKGKKRKMIIEKNVLRLEETDENLQIKIGITYFTMPRENFAAIVRRVRIENLDGKPKRMEVLDGLPQLLPSGVTNDGYKSMSNVSRAWFDVYNLDQKIAFYRVRASIEDSEEVSEVREGNFYLSFSTQQRQLLKPIVDMDLIFGANTSLLFPEAFTAPIAELYEKEQVTTNKTSGGFAGEEFLLQDTYEMCTLIGHVADIDMINRRAEQFSFSYINKKEQEARSLAEEVVSPAYMRSGNEVFDEYVRQCYLDNILRGGYPLVFKGEKANKVYHVFSRKHGDLEREYNFFSTEPSFYSQGNGNYRDVNQNRRNDIFFDPEVGDFNVKQFMDLIQIDGYNPLHVKGSTFTLPVENMQKLMQRVLSEREQVEALLRGRFTPGKIYSYLYNENVRLDISYDEFINELMELAEQSFEASFGEGYWSDHWTYNMDLVESYLKIYPDRLENFLFEDRTYQFFDSPMKIAPRDEKYVITNGKVRQFGALYEDKEKLERLCSDPQATNWLKTQNGRGEIYRTTLYGKLFSLMLNKFSILDPYGIGIEMEGGRPGWNDSMNGLPGLFGSGVSETAELKRIVEFLQTHTERFRKKIYLPIEIAEFYENILKKLRDQKAGKYSPFQYWDEVSTLREDYREQVRFGITGEEREIDTKMLEEGLSLIRTKLEEGLEQAAELGNGIYPTYLSYRAKQYDILPGKFNPINGYQNVRVKEFELQVLPLYLEGPAKALKNIKDAAKAGELYQKVKESDIYDRKLKMYKTSESIESLSHEVGRSRAFTPGWLEREAVFMHMEFKYLLAELKAGLYGEFFEDITTMLPPFMKPEVYGRSVLENSSFIASSVNPDPQTHGRGYVARLTGATAEMLSMWIMMLTGEKVFTYENNKLKLFFEPILPGWLFDQNGEICFRFLGKTLVTYHNPSRANTYGQGAVSVRKILLDDLALPDGKAIEGEQAKSVRAGTVKRIDIFLG